MWRQTWIALYTIHTTPDLSSALIHLEAHAHIGIHGALVDPAHHLRVDAKGYECLVAVDVGDDIKELFRREGDHSPLAVHSVVSAGQNSTVHGREVGVNNLCAVVRLT